jgi:murein DD-endopeptidase MepM/ murein hydrolase activator NlpD
MDKVKKFVAPLLLGAFIFSATINPNLAAWAAEEIEQIEQIETELKDINQRMEEQASKVRLIKRKVGNASGQLEAVEEELSEHQGELNAIEKRLNVTRQDIERNRQLMAEAERRIADRTVVLNKRVRDIYEYGQVSYADVLFGSTDFADFTTRYEVLRRVVSADVALINKVKADRELIAEKKAALERDIPAMEKLRQEALAKRNVIAEKRKEKQVVLNKLANEQGSAEQAYNELMRASQRIENMLRARKPGGLPSGSTGSYIWPADGVITSNFGWRTHPVFGNARLHAGMDIGSDYGSAVIAADGGLVVNSGWISGYGYTVIIEHNGTYSTLYAHCSELLVNEGQYVRKGQLIAKVGDTGYTTGPNLHFEVRVNGAPQDPRGYLP